VPVCRRLDRLVRTTATHHRRHPAIGGGKVTIQPAYSDAFANPGGRRDRGRHVYEVVLEDGRKVEARFAGAAADQQTLIVEEQPLAIGITDIATAAPPPPYSEGVSHVDLNATWSDGNTDSQNTLLFADTRWRFGVHRHLAVATIAREEVNGIDTKKQDLLRYEYNRLLDGSWYVGGTASYERDPLKELDHRYTVGALVGRDIFNDNVAPDRQSGRRLPKRNSPALRQRHGRVY
jgi:hypothetical protein